MIKNQVEKAFRKADELKEEYDDNDQKENVTIPRIEVVYRELNSADLNYKNLLQSGESELESLIYEETFQKSIFLLVVLKFVKGTP